MKKLNRFPLYLMLSAFVLFASCAEETEEKTEKKPDESENVVTLEEVPEEIPEMVVDVAPTQLTSIDDFLNMLDGSEEAAEMAIAVYGSQDVIDNGMIPFGGSPTIVSSDGDCHTVDLIEMDEGEEVVNTYSFCIADGKISEFDWVWD